MRTGTFSRRGLRTLFDGELRIRIQTLAYRGSFTMRLPPGLYRVKCFSELADAVARQLHGEVAVRGAAEPARVRLKAREESRRIRRTLAPEATGSGGRR